MQKVLRQNLLARNQRVKVARRSQLKLHKEQWDEFKQGKLRLDRATRQAVKDERKSRREDWIEGPLAPNRDVGVNKGTYGTTSPFLSRYPDLPKTETFKKDEQLFAVGDRVVVVRGTAKGRIGKIKEISWSSGTVIVDGVNMADVPVPSWAQGAQQRPDKFLPSELPVPLNDVRLVIRAPDPNTKAEVDVVIRYMTPGEPKLERPHGSNLPEHTRYVEGMTKWGTKVPIGWPDDQPREFQSEPGDTLRQAVEEVTFMPVVAEPVMPEGVIDELRSKFKRGRERHDYEWMKKKLMEDAKELWEKSRKAAIPQAEYREMMVAQRQKNVFIKQQSQKSGLPGMRKPVREPVILSPETLDIIRAEMELAKGKAGRSQRSLAQ